jgi:predicted ATPase/class 3 adenylate cyclase
MPQLQAPIETRRGTRTLLFTDVEGSTQLLQRFGEESLRMLADHMAILRDTFADFGGQEVDAAGDGLFLAFESASDALAAALTAQRRLASHPWSAGEPVRVRIGMHTGEPIASGGGFVGLDVHRAARITAAGHGGQVLLSESTRHLVAHNLLPHVTLRDLGLHRLKDLQNPEHVFQACAPGLRKDFPPLRSIQSGPGTLPADGTPLVGRAAELRALRRLLTEEHARLVTLTGPGGAGKTRLSLALASEVAREFADGVVLVQLAATPDSVLVSSAIAQVLSLAPHDETPEEAVVAHLRNRHLLLVLDNFEHVVGAASAVADILRSCPRVRVLVTSRVPLSLTGEHDFPVPPLALPDSRRDRTLAQLMRYDSVELFRQRARAVDPHFELDDDTAPSVAEICRKLDGLPLAIELAAARVRMFPPRALLARLDRRLELLSGGARDMPARHRTLRQAIAWSHDLLDPAEQALFRRLAAFAGGATLDAIDAVSRAAGEIALSSLDGISALVDKSLLRPDAAADDEPRFTMLETIREFALEQLASSGEEAVTRTAHADFFIQLAERVEPELTGPMQLKWLDRLGRDHENYRAIFAWAERTLDSERGLRLGAALWRFWVVRGHMAEGRTRLARVLSLPSDPGSASVRQKVLTGAATMAHEDGAPDESYRLGEEALAIARSTGDRPAEGRTLTHLGWVCFQLGRHEQGRELSKRGLELHREVGDERGVALALNNLGWIANTRADYLEAIRLHEESMSARRRVGDARGVAFAQGNLAWALIERGELGRAQTLVDEAIETLRALGDLQLLSYLLMLLGELRIAEDRLPDARVALEEAATHAREIGHPWNSVEAQTRLGTLRLEMDGPDAAATTAEFCEDAMRLEFDWVRARTMRLWADCHCLLGRRDEARARILEASGILASLSARGDMVRCLICAAAIEAAHGRPESVAVARGAVDRLIGKLGQSLPPMLLRRREAASASARSALEPEAFASAYEEGLALDWREAVGRIIG